MGLKGLTRWFREDFPAAFEPCSSACLQGFDHVLIDCNSMIHEAVCSSPARPDSPDFHGAVLDALLARIDSVLERKCVARRLRYLAILFDGPAPIAKLTLQRSRRERMVRQQERGGDARRLHVTPGTELMRFLGCGVRAWAAKRLREPSWGSARIVVSDSCVPGEGEAKAQQELLRAQPARALLVSDDGDAKLIAVALLASAPRARVAVSRSAGCATGPACELFWAAGVARGGPGRPVAAARARDLVVISLLGGCDLLPPLRGPSPQQIWARRERMERGWRPHPGAAGRWRRCACRAARPPPLDPLLSPPPGGGVPRLNPPALAALLDPWGPGGACGACGACGDGAEAEDSEAPGLAAAVTEGGGGADWQPRGEARADAAAYLRVLEWAAQMLCNAATVDALGGCYAPPAGASPLEVAACAAAPGEEWRGARLLRHGRAGACEWGAAAHCLLACPPGGEPALPAALRTPELRAAAAAVVAELDALGGGACAALRARRRAAAALDRLAAAVQALPPRALPADVRVPQPAARLGGERAAPARKRARSARGAGEAGACGAVFT